VVKVAQYIKNMRHFLDCLEATLEEAIKIQALESLEPVEKEMD
jgi:hypothetical protein